MFFIFVFAALSINPAKITAISVSDMYNEMYKLNGLDKPKLANDYLNNDTIKETFFIFRQAGDLEKGEKAPFYEVTGTPEEIAQFKASISLLPPSNSTIDRLPEHNVVFIQLRKSASYYQQGVFWVCIVAFIIFIGGVASGLLLWHYDRYDLDPANSLLFVTEGNLIVSGANDPK